MTKPEPNRYLVLRLGLRLHSRAPVAASFDFRLSKLERFGGDFRRADDAGR